MRADAGELRDQRVRHAVGEILLLGIAREVRERQHGERVDARYGIGGVAALEDQRSVDRGNDGEPGDDHRREPSVESPRRRRNRELWRRALHRRRLRFGNAADEAIAAPADGLDVFRLGGGVSERRAQLVDGVVQAVVEIDEHFRRPEPRPELLARHDLAGSREQRHEHFERPFLEPHSAAAVPQFAGFRIELERTEPDLVVVHA